MMVSPDWKKPIEEGSSREKSNACSGGYTVLENSTVAGGTLKIRLRDTAVSHQLVPVSAAGVLGE